MLIPLDVALSVTRDSSRDVKAVNSQGRGVSLAIIKGITKKKKEIKLEK